MVDVDYKFLRFVEYKGSSTWAPNFYINATSIKSAFPLVSLRKIIKPRKDRLKSKNYDGIIDIVEKIRFFDGKIFFRTEKNPKNDLYISKMGDLIVSNINFEKGAFAINLFGDIATSTDYQPYEIIYKLNKEYFNLILRSEKFLSSVKGIKPGGMKTRAKYDFIKTFSVPIPNSLEAQQEIVSKYNQTIVQALECEKKANELELGIDKLLFDELGIKKTEIVSTEVSEYAFLNFIEYNTLDIWSANYLLNRRSCDFIKTGKYNAVQAKKFIKSFQYGLSEKASVVKKGIPMLRMNNIVNSEITLNTVKYLDVDESVFKKHILNKGDLLFNRTNSKELVGKTAIFNLDEKYTFASYLIRVVLDEEIVNPVYINILFNSPIVRCQIDLISRQVLGQANINSVEMQMLRFPLPPIEIQNIIVKKIEDYKLDIKTLRNQVQTLHEKAKKDFEQEVFCE